MTRLTLAELNPANREEGLRFLRELWSGRGGKCPLCGGELVPLHGKAKKSDCDWQCRACDKTVKTIALLDELNRELIEHKPVRPDLGELARRRAAEKNPTNGKGTK